MPTKKLPDPIKVGVRGLKAEFAKYAQLIRQGRIILVTSRGSPVGLMVPMGIFADVTLDWLTTGEMRTHLASIFAEVSKSGKKFVLTQSGKPIANIVPFKD